MIKVMKRSLVVSALTLAIGLPTGAAIAGVGDPSPNPTPSSVIEDETSGSGARPDWSQGHMSSPQMRAEHKEHQKAGGAMAGHMGGRPEGRMDGQVDGYGDRVDGRLEGGMGSHMGAGATI